MKTYKLNDMVRGWFVGDFEPSIIKSKDVEVGIKEYKKGDLESKHHHKVATELTAIVSGRVKMNGCVYEKGDIIVILPNEASDFEALEDSTTVVVKLPSAKNDKYLGEAQ